MIRPYPDRGAAKQAKNIKHCDAPDCGGEGEYRAPKSRAELHDYYWFCLDHVKEYNKAWDYCRGMNAMEIENMIRTSLTGGAPTWPLGMNASNDKNQKYWRVKEDLARDHVYEEFLKSGGRARAQKKTKAADTPKDQALRALELPEDADFVMIRKRYRALVKQHHPDIDPSDQTRHDKIQKINQAYAVLKALYQNKD